MARWKKIDGFCGKYMISDYGAIKNTNTHKQFMGRLHKESGYLRAYLRINGTAKDFSVHRLVGLHFIKNENPNVFNQINHIDGNKTNNHYTNLEWINNSGNQKHAYSIGLKKPYCINKGKFGKMNHLSKPIIQCDLNGVFIKEWECLMQIKRQNGYDPSFISNCCKGKYKKAYKYIWKYKN
jgi:hypothetical protein